MQVTQLILATFGVLAAAQQVGPDKLITDFKTLTRTLDDLTTTTKSFTGGFLGSTAVAAQSAKVSAAVAQMNTDAANLAQLDDAAAEKVMSSVQAMETPLDNTLTAIVDKKQTFSSLFRPRIVSSLNKLVNATIALAETLKTKASADFGKKIDKESNKLDERFKQAVKDFGA